MIDNTQFLCPIFLNQHAMSIFPQVASYPYVLVASTPFYGYSHIQQKQQKFCSNNSVISLLKTQKLNFQQNKINCNVSMIKQQKISTIPRKQKRRKIQRLRDEKGRYYGIKQVQKQYKQNLNRNIINSVLNELLSFITQLPKSTDLLKKIDTYLSQEQVSSFYTFMLNIQKIINDNLSIKKIRKFWFPNDEYHQSSKSKNVVLLRRISYYYLNNMVHLSILNSNQIKNSSKIFYIKAIKVLIKELSSQKQL